MTPKISEEQSEARRIQILMATWECFADKGYDQTTMRDISKLSGLSIGAIYNYFEGKDDIIQAMLEWSKSQKNTAFGIISMQKSARAAMGEFFRMFINSIDMPSTKKVSQGDISLWAEGMRREYIRDIFEEDHEWTREQLKEIIQRGIENGEIRNGIDAGAFAGMFMALILGLLVQSTLLRDIDIRTYLSQIEEALFANIWQD